MLVKLAPSLADCFLIVEIASSALQEKVEVIRAKKAPHRRVGEL